MPLDFEERAQARGTYDLILVIMHRGNGTGGHSILHMCVKATGNLCNDEQITRITDQQMEQIAGRGYGIDQQTIPVLFVYERSEAVARKSDLHKQRAAVFPQPAAANNVPAQTYRPTGGPAYAPAGFAMAPAQAATPVRRAPVQARPSARNRVVARQPVRQPVRQAPKAVVRPTATRRVQARPVVRQAQRRVVAPQRRVVPVQRRAMAAVARRVAQPQRRTAAVRKAVPTRAAMKQTKRR